jgi:UPF0716 protein FxsA
MKRQLLLLAVLVPVLEVILIIWIGKLIGGWPTFLLLLLTSLLGAYLLKVKGSRLWWQMRMELEWGRLPAETLGEGLCVLLTGFLLLVPGFLTDFAGILLLVPPVRRFIRRLFKGWVADLLMRGTWRIFMR